MAHNAPAETKGFAVEVWFATSPAPRIIAVFPTEDSALREARSYLSDSRSVRVLRPDGSAIILKS